MKAIPKLRWTYDFGSWKTEGINGCGYRIDVCDSTTEDERDDGKFLAWQQISGGTSGALGRRAKNPPRFKCLCGAMAAVEAYDHKHKPSEKPRYE